MKNIIIALSFMAGFLSLAQAEESRDPAMENFGPKVVQETLDETQKGVFTWELSYLGDIGRNFSGGNRVGSSYLSVAMARGYLDLEKGLGWKGAHIFAHVQGMHGNVPSLVTGDAQIASNIESYANTVRFMEMWYKQAFDNNRVSFLFGLLDLNSEFYLTESSLLFVNSSFGLGTELAQLGPDGRTASTFPVTSLAAKMRYAPTEEFYFDAAVFDAMPGAMDSTGTKVRLDEEGEGYMLITEAGWTPEDTKIAVGAWTYTKPYDHIHDINTNGDAETGRNYGTYVMGEHYISKSLAAFARYGVASASVNRFKDNLAFGVSATGLLPGREEDKFGLGLTQVSNTDGYKKAMKRNGESATAAETVIEMTYRYKVSKNLFVQPDLQYIINPGTNPDFSNALTGFLRFQIDFDK